MNARPIETPKDDKEELEKILNLIGSLDGQNNSEEFQAVKEQMLSSGMSSNDLLGLFGENLTDFMFSRPEIPMLVELLTETAHIPTYAHDSDACADIYADEDYTFAPGETHPVSTGFALGIPQGYVVHIYPRSGLSVKSPLRLANSVGVIDEGYKDEVKVPLWNSSNTESYTVHKGDRIAQLTSQVSPFINFNVADSVKEIGEDRQGGFGSTGE